ncbi:unnamed protein product [Choristocarpus tenellus]
MGPPRCECCGGTDINPSNDASGDLTCARCYTVFQENTIVSSVQFSESGGTSSVVGQFVSGDKSRPGGGGGRGRPRFNTAGSDSRDTTINNGRKKISQVIQQLHLRPSLLDVAHRMFTLAVHENYVQGRKTLHIVAACVYIVCRKENYPVMLIDISDKLGVNVYVLGKTFQRLVTFLRMQHEVPIVDPALYISRFAAKLDLGKKRQIVCTTALKIIAQMKRDFLASGRQPAGVCCAALVISTRVNQIERTNEEIRMAVKVCDSTVRKRLQEYEQTPASQLTVQQLHALPSNGALPGVPGSHTGTTGGDKAGTTAASVSFDPPSFITNRIKDGCLNLMDLNVGSQEEEEAVGGKPSEVDKVGTYPGSGDDEGRGGNNRGSAKGRNGKAKASIARGRKSCSGMDSGDGDSDDTVSEDEGDKLGKVNAKEAKATTAAAGEEAVTLPELSKSMKKRKRGGGGGEDKLEDEREGCGSEDSGGDSGCEGGGGGGKVEGKGKEAKAKKGKPAKDKGKDEEVVILELDTDTSTTEGRQTLARHVLRVREGQTKRKRTRKWHNKKDEENERLFALISENMDDDFEEGETIKAEAAKLQLKAEKKEPQDGMEEGGGASPGGRKSSSKLKEDEEVEGDSEGKLRAAGASTSAVGDGRGEEKDVGHGQEEESAVGGDGGEDDDLDWGLYIRGNDEFKRKEEEWTKKNADWLKDREEKDKLEAETGGPPPSVPRKKNRGGVG